MVSVPVRGLIVGLATAARLTVPESFPLAPPVIVSQPSALVAVQAQPVSVVTVTLAVPAPAPMVWVSGATPYVQAAPAWVIVTIWPAMVSVPVRGVIVGFAAAVTFTLPESLPLAPLVIVSQPTPLVAVHAQPVSVVTVTLAAPPLAPI